VATVAGYAMVTFSMLLLLSDIHFGSGQDLTMWWRIVYWTQFMLSFLVLPFLI
jgi:hypothetical protein